MTFLGANHVEKYKKLNHRSYNCFSTKYRDSECQILCNNYEHVQKCFVITKMPFLEHVYKYL